MKGFFLAGIATASSVLFILAACGDGDQPPTVTTRPGPTGVDASSGVAGLDAGTPVLPVLGPLRVDTTPTVEVMSSRVVALHTTVSGGAGPYRVSFSQTAGPTVVFIDGDTLNPTFTSPSIATPTDLA